MTLYNKKKAFLFIVLLLISESAVALSTLPDIAFYGRVIDQYGQPVKNASVGYTGENAHLSAGGGMGSVRTDEAGYFIIETTGAALELSGIGHPEIDSVSFETPNRLTSTSTKSPKEFVIRFLSHDKSGAVLNYNNYSEKSKAYIVNAWRLGEYEGALGGDVIARYDADGKYYTLLLEQEVYDNRLKEGKTAGNIHVSCTRPHMEGIRDYGDWRVSITPINGGIQETTDLYMNEAPETGYKPSLNIVMNKGDSNYRPYLRNKRYYFKSNNGKEYGSLFIHFQPFISVKRETCRLDIYYRINPTGSRNLELRR